MSPADLAQRLAALDWSATSLQHQLAVSAAVETLTGKAMPDVRKLALSSAYGKMKDEAERIKDGALPLPNEPTSGVAINAVYQSSCVVQLPVRPRTCWTTLCHLDGREWARSSHFGPGGAWNWILESVAHEHSVSEDQIGGMEDDDGCDLVTVDGLPVYRIEHIAS